MACDWLLIDGSSLLFRAYYGAVASARINGGDADTIGGFLDRLARLVSDRRPSRLVIAEDQAWRPQWRVDLVAGDKAHRVAEPVPSGTGRGAPGDLRAAGADRDRCPGCR